MVKNVNLLFALDLKIGSKEARKLVDFIDKSEKIDPSKYMDVKEELKEKIFEAEKSPNSNTPNPSPLSGSGFFKGITSLFRSKKTGESAGEHKPMPRDEEEMKSDKFDLLELDKIYIGDTSNNAAPKPKSEPVQLIDLTTP